MRSSVLWMRLKIEREGGHAPNVSVVIESTETPLFGAVNGKNIFWAEESSCLRKH